MHAQLLRRIRNNIPGGIGSFEDEGITGWMKKRYAGLREQVVWMSYMESLRSHTHRAGT